MTHSYDYDNGRCVCLAVLGTGNAGMNLIAVLQGNLEVKEYDAGKIWVP